MADSSGLLCLSVWSGVVWFPFCLVFVCWGKRWKSPSETSFVSQEALGFWFLPFVCVCMCGFRKMFVTTWVVIL